MKRKQFQKGIEQLAEEGAIQVYQEPSIGTETYIIGVVGELQFDVLEFRLKNEYKVDLHIQHLPSRLARWVTVEDQAKMPQPGELKIGSSALEVLDKDDRLVLLFESEWASSWVEERNPGIKLLSIQDLEEAAQP